MNKHIVYVTALLFVCLFSARLTAQDSCPIGVNKATEITRTQLKSSDLQPGDVIVYAGGESKATDPAASATATPSPPKSGEDSEPPKEYVMALAGATHAAVIARDADGKIFKIDSPPHPRMPGNYKFPEKYFVVIRPKFASDKERRDYQTKTNETALKMFPPGQRELPFDYNFQMTIAAEPAVRDYYSRVMKTGHLPPQSCSSFARTMTLMNGGPAVRTTTLEELLKKVVEAAKKDPKRTDAAVEEMIAYYTNDNREALRAAQKGQIQMKQQIDNPETEQDRKLLEIRKKSYAQNELLIRGLQAEVSSVDDAASKLKIALRGMIDAKSTEGRTMALASLVAGATHQPDPLKQPIVRPADFISSAESDPEHFEIAGFVGGEGCDSPPPARPQIRTQEPAATSRAVE